jgi:hypothetical protein
LDEFWVCLVVVARPMRGLSDADDRHLAGRCQWTLSRAMKPWPCWAKPQLP